MKATVKLIVLALVIGAISCKKENSTLEPEKTVDYKLIDSLLNARGRYWVIEKITRVSGKEELEYISDNGARSDSLLGVWWHGGYIANVNFRFLTGEIIQRDGGGVWGPLPYTSAAKFHVYNFSSRGGTWGWASDYSKVNVKLPETLELIFRHISKIDSGSFEGYLNPSSYPVYGSVEDIKTAGKSERIKIIMDVADNARTMSFIFTLRAVWVDSSPYGGSRVSVYDKVIY